MKYAVTFYYHSNCTVEVEAENEREAKEMAYSMLGGEDTTNQILEGLQEDDSPTIEEI